MSKASSTCVGSRLHPLVIAAIALGAFLIFLIQPLAARALLPAFGGSGSVWVTALVFYQTALAVGYLLTHLIHTRLTMRGQAIALVLLSLGALLTLSVLPEPIDGGNRYPAWQLLLSLAFSVGPPFLVLAVAGPLVQGWATARDGETRTGREIYSLYAISNGASLLALAAYPFVVEPLWGILQQGRIWDGLFVFEVLLLVVISWRFARPNRVAAKPKRRGDANTSAAQFEERPRTLLWLSWSAAGVMALTSTAGFIGQEIAAAPLLWVVPLALYLVTWIVAFSGVVRPGVVARGRLALVALILLVPAVDIRLGMACEARLGCALAGMTLVCFLVHASLYEQRPDGRQLTRFYAAVAAGGAVGGIFAGVVAVQVFQDWRELGLAFSLIALLAGSGLIRRLRAGKMGPSRRPTYGLVGLLAIGCCLLLAVTGMARPGLLYKHRDFHGLVRVVEEGAGCPQQHRLVLYHGTTVHGSQFLDPARRGIPTTYFGAGSGAEIAVRAQRTLVGTGRGLNIGTVGLGAGTMAAHLRAQDAMRFYELSPAVAEIARGEGALGDSGHRFSYLRDAAGKVDVIVGDARLSLAAELDENPKGNAYDLLVLDAFAGDAVPVHLLTAEAFSLYTRHLSATGMIAMHVSSNWLDLVPVAYAWADAGHWQALTISTRGGAAGNNAVWVLLFRNPSTLRILAGQCRPLMATGKIRVQNLRNVSYGDLQPWTDNRNDLLSLMRAEVRLRD